MTEPAKTVSADSKDELPPMVCIVRASGEGVTDWKLCRTEAEIRAAYVEMVCGSDDEHHKDAIDGIMEEYRGERWRGDTLKIDLYCASFTITRFPADCLTPPFVPTHLHIDGGLYRLVTGARYKTGLEDRWSDCIIYEADDRKLYVTTPERWTDRFAPLTGAST